MLSNIGERIPPVNSSHIYHLEPGLKHQNLFRIQDSMVGHAVTIIIALSYTVPCHKHMNR
jgi:hypothetical protein